MTLYDSAKKDFLKTIDAIAGRHTPEQVFTDFVSMAAMSISNAVDFKQEREKKYLDLIGKDEPDEQAHFPELLAITTKGFEAKFGDFLGECFEELGASNSKTGQFFTPYHLSRMMADMLAEDQERYRLCEPACGSGGMVIAFSEALRAKGKNQQRVLHAYCQDIDLRAVQMTYIQLSLLGISAVVDHMDTLRMERISSPWKTPAYMMGPALWMMLEEQNAPEVEKPLGQLTLFEEESA